MQLALAWNSGSACGVFPGQVQVGHTVPSVSAYNFTVCDDKAQLHRDKHTDFRVALIQFMLHMASLRCMQVFVDMRNYSKLQ